MNGTRRRRWSIAGCGRTGGGYLSHVLGPTLLIAAGLPAVAVATNTMVAARAPAGIPGTASGLLTTAQQLGGAIGLASWAGISAAAQRADVAADTAGMPVAYLTAGLVALAAAAITRGERP